MRGLQGVQRIRRIDKQGQACRILIADISSDSPQEMNGVVSISAWAVMDGSRAVCNSSKAAVQAAAFGDRCYALNLDPGSDVFSAGAASFSLTNLKTVRGDD